MCKISLIASSVRHHLWLEMMDSLFDNTIEYEVVLAGNLDTFQVRPYIKRYKNLRYIHTADIKPAQCYEVARRESKGELILWIADDCEFESGILDDVYSFYKSLNNEKALVSMRTNENNMDNNLNDHRFFGGNVNTPLMAPIGLISNDYLKKLGGFDSRFKCGQYENFTAMQVWEDGGEVVKYESKTVFIEHLVKHGKGTKFWTGYDYDRNVLENAWVFGGYAPTEKPLRVWVSNHFEYYYPISNREVSKKNLGGFIPYKDEDILTVSQGEWR